VFGEQSGHTSKELNKLAQIVEPRKDEIERHGMNISPIELSFDESMMWLDLSDGRKLGVPLACFPRLLRATPEQRLQYEMSGSGSGLHWKALDEDISVEGLLMGIGDQTQGHSLVA